MYQFYDGSPISFERILSIEWHRQARCMCGCTQQLLAAALLAYALQERLNQACALAAAPHSQGGHP
eukprot:356118-Chlamydomonas_euryale.AAC.8